VTAHLELLSSASDETLTLADRQTSWRTAVRLCLLRLPCVGPAVGLIQVSRVAISTRLDLAPCYF